MDPVSDDEFFDAQSHRRQPSSGFVERHVSREPRFDSRPLEKEVDNHNTTATTALFEPGADQQQSVKSRAHRQQLRERWSKRHNAVSALTAEISSNTQQQHYSSPEFAVESQTAAPILLDDNSLSPENWPVATQSCNVDFDRDRKIESDRLRQLDDQDSASQYIYVSQSTPAASSPLTRDSRVATTPPRALHAHDSTLAALTRAMDPVHDDDLFMQEAEDNGTARLDRLLSRRSVQDKRRSLPPTEMRAFTSMEERRPRTSGGARPASRSGLLRDHDDSGSVTTFAMNGVDMRPRRGSRYSGAAERQPFSPQSPRAERVKSPELIYGRMRPSSAAPASALLRRTSQLVTRLQESEGDSPADSSEPKQSLPESTSADSQTAPSTVWDELDDLKSRIKKLELTGKLPPTSGAAMDSSPQMERPRTATTAPTTIDSSPKREKKAEEHKAAGEEEEEQVQSPVENMQPSHPLLHSALAKAKPLLSPALYRSLEATSADALQLASLAASLGSTSSSSGGVSDRQMRRKADTMCRNLTDLCLALCDGKHENTRPLLIDIPTATPPSGRFSRAASRLDSDPRSGERPMSRLEARRSSILGTSSVRSPPSVSPRRDAEDLSASEVDTPSQYLSVDRQRFTRSSSRLSSARFSRYDDASGDEDPTIRPPSRNGSEFSFRGGKVMQSRETADPPRRSFSLREALTNRRSSGGPAGHRELSRVASMTSEHGRRWTRESTPPVLEEEVSEQEQHNPEPISQPRQRMTSLGHLRHRALKETPLRSSSITRRASQLAVE